MNKVCYVPQQDDDGNQVYTVVSPVGYHDVEMIKQAPRLDSLNGKTFALIGGSFMAVTTITGNCGCGLCTTKETGNSIAAAPLGYEPIENFYINGKFNKKEAL